jgi:hypothetical protein
MDFIFGLFVGRWLRTKNGVVALLLLPFVFMVFIALGAFVVFGTDWYKTSLANLGAVPAWYAWPWDWPGVRAASMLLAQLGQLFGIAGSLELYTLDSSTSLFPVLHSWMLNFFGALVAITINVMVAMLPVYVIGNSLNLYQFHRDQRKKIRKDFAQN